MFFVVSQYICCIQIYLHVNDVTFKQIQFYLIGIIIILPGIIIGPKFNLTSAFFLQASVCFVIPGIVLAVR